MNQDQNFESVIEESTYHSKWCVAHIFLDEINFNKFHAIRNRTVQGDSTVLSPLSAESWQPLSVLRVQVRGSLPTNQPSFLCLHGLQPCGLSRVQCWVAMRRYFLHSRSQSRLPRLDSPFEKHIQHKLLASQHKLFASQQHAKKSGIILHFFHFAIFPHSFYLLVFP